MINGKKDGKFIDSDKEQSRERKIQASRIAFKWEQTKQEIIEAD